MYIEQRMKSEKEKKKEEKKNCKCENFIRIANVRLS